ncbi:hypothetical protein HY468_05100 [Candidatus Roizmanbacteria bacterium]|nr:hypothetical protein [Candidatus Roizmanbacteria bacterium]
MGNLLTNRNFYSVALAVVISFAFVAVMVNGASTISSNISTDGTFTVTGDSTFTGDVFATSTMAVTGQASFYDQVVLDSAASDPTGVSAGAIYWDTANEVIRVFDGIDWNTVSSSTDASGGLILAGDGQGVRFNTIANGYMALGTTTLPVVAVDSGNAVLHVNATTSASVPLVIVGSGAFGGNLFNVYTHQQTEVFSLDPMGNASTTMLSTNVIAVDALVVSGYATTSGSTGNFDTEGNIAATGSLTMTGATVLNGAVTLGDAAGDAIIINGNASTTNLFTVRGEEFSVGGFSTTTVSLTEGFATTTYGFGLGSALGIGTSTPELSSKLAVAGSIYADNGSATTSLILSTSSETIGSCIQMKASDGATLRIYATTTYATDTFRSLVIEAGTCQ